MAKPPTSRYYSTSRIGDLRTQSTKPKPNKNGSAPQIRLVYDIRASFISHRGPRHFPGVIPTYAGVLGNFGHLDDVNFIPFDCNHRSCRRNSLVECGHDRCRHTSEFTMRILLQTNNTLRQKSTISHLVRFEIHAFG